MIFKYSIRRVTWLWCTGVLCVMRVLRVTCDLQMVVRNERGGGGLWQHRYTAPQTHQHDDSDDSDDGW